MKTNILLRPIQVLLFLFLVLGGLYFAKSFLVPICLAWLLALLLLPIAKKLEYIGWKRGLSTLACVFILLGAIALISVLLSTQIAGLAKDTDQIEEKVKRSISKGQAYINHHLGITPGQQMAAVKKQAESGGGKVSGHMMTLVGGSLSVIGNFILVMVYVFLFLYFRHHFRRSLFKAVSDENKPQLTKVIAESAEATQKYLGGLSLMIVCLWIMYGIGFSIAGVKHALFFAILCGLLEIVPFIGNLTGTAITALMALAQGGSGVLIGILVTYFVVQFLQTYFLEPLVVGAGVNIHPAITIIAIVAGELVWGIAGMVLVLPMLAVVKIILDKIPELQPYGFLIGSEKSK